MATTRTFYSGDRPCLRLYAKDLDGNVLPLTGFTVTFRYKNGTAAAVEGAATIVDADLGIAEFWVPTGLAAGDLWWEWKIVDGSGRPATGPQKRRHAEVIAILT
jgi:hypothetical protein